MNLTISDKKIINALIDNPRKSYRELAKEVHVSVATIGNRLKNLEKNSIIKKYSTIIDYDQIGYDTHVMINIRVSRGQEKTVEKKLFNSPNVTAIYDITGEFDILVIARFKNRNGLDVYLKTIQAYEFVQRTQTNLVLSTIKERPIQIS
ncbi:AsnC family transcriptional regulator [Candidatus Pacearchaeota archaeon CG10_big_fil_rev_8_21_14_0_10_31_9]|nr:MAG: AsnC family transcriptional regulator [Candidatus Pacearchaeota archaeon CG10_big_fil_rev_8_21_14_0_10_31_9]PIZ83574.1 MAG: AsnC family transcriptional regulator [Candidatus Pacearchaeota archaeon CG_4_10_14_0_2_um_filter_05_32_18]